MERETMQHSKEFVMPEVSATLAGNLTIGHEGEGRIVSPIETQEQAEQYLERAKSKLVKLDPENSVCAVCMDGRGCRCLASDVGGSTLPDFNKPPVRAKMAGGLYDMATMMALLGGWHGLGDVKAFDEARQVVGRFLAENGYEDGAHTTDMSFDSDDTTECGAWMKKDRAMQKGAAQWQKGGSANQLDLTVGALNGIEDIQADPEYQQVRERQKKFVDQGLFATFDPVATRDQMKQEKPQQLELLYSDPNHPTHNHKEPMLVVEEVKGYSVDRDEMYQEDGFAPFVDSRWLRREIAGVMSVGNELEAKRLLMAGDVTTVDVSDELIAPGMPVGILTAA